MAPEAVRNLTTEIDADVLDIHQVWVRNLVRDPAEGSPPEKTVVAWVDDGGRSDVRAWLAPPDAGESHPDVRTDWIFFSAALEAILIGVVEDEPSGATFRFNLKFGADTYRRHLELLARSGLLGLTAEPLEPGPERQIESPCIFVPIQTGPLRAFLRELPPVPVV
jgi:hypothetical protein